MFNSDNMVPKKISSEEVPRNSTVNVKKSVPNTRKEFKDVLQGKDESLVDDDVEAGKEKLAALAKSKQNRTKSIFDLSAHQGEKLDVAEDSPQTKQPLFPMSKTPLSTEMSKTPLSTEMSKTPLSTRSMDPSQLANLEMGQVSTKFLDKPEFAQEVTDIAAIVPNLAALQQTPTSVIKMKKSEPLDANIQVPPSVPLETNIQLPTSEEKTSSKDRLAPISQSSSKESDARGSESNLTAAVPIPVSPFLINKTAPTSEAVKLSPTIQEVIDQIVDKIYTLQTSGRTDTVVTFNHPALLEGMQLTLSTFDTAKKEFNLTFSNLTQAGQTLLESNLGVLKTELDRLGVVTHMIITTTQNESIISTTTDEKTFGNPRDRDQNPQEQKKKK